jgi:BirA family biotin operon repressor/biotin-[acetyl-CoA-carboxylase] ligase
MFPLFIGKNRILLKEVDSTNNYAFNLLKEKKAPEGTLITASKQLSGRGQRGNTWLSEPEKNFIGSIILYPAFLAARDQFWLNKAVSVAVRDTVSQFLPNHLVKIKWPNDIFVGRKKLGGILMESQVVGSNFSVMVVGIGVNVNQRIFLNGNFEATSIALELGREVNLEDFTNILSEHLEIRYYQTKAANFHLIETDFNKSLFALNQQIAFEWFGKVYRGEILCVTENGFLCMKINGEVKVFQNGEIKLLPNFI